MFRIRNSAMAIRMAAEPKPKSQSDSLSDSEVFRYGGAGTVLLIALLAFVGLHPLMMGGIAARLLGGVVLATILVSGTIAASRSHVHRAIGLALAISALGLQAIWLATGDTTVEAVFMAVFAAFASTRPR
jgi:hypothetical protein